VGSDVNNKDGAGVACSCGDVTRVQATCCLLTESSFRATISKWTRAR